MRLLLLLFGLSSCMGHDFPDWQAYVEHEPNGLRQHYSEGAVSMDATYRPPAWQVWEATNGQYSDSLLLAEEQRVCIAIEASVKGHSLETYASISGKLPLELLLHKTGQYFSLNGLRPIQAIMPRMYGQLPYSQILLVFNKPAGFPWHLRVERMDLPGGALPTFTFTEEAIANIPKLNWKNEEIATPIADGR